MKGEVPHGASVQVQGQAVTMKAAYVQLLVGLAFSILLVYLVIVVNFQSWLDPFIIITALPGALTGIVWSLFLTGTTLSVPALTGAIMCMGTATANSILVVSFARDELAAHGDAIRAAVTAGYTRLRPVLMTALAMVIGMLPMSMANTQNAPLGRAVIGGLLVATFATLMFVPCVFALLHQKRPVGEVAMSVGEPHEATHAVDDRVAGGGLGGIAGATASWRRERTLAALARAATEQATVPVQIIIAAARTLHAPARPAGNGARLVRGADLCAGLRIRAELDQGLRRRRQGGAAAGDDRCAELGCPVRSGEGESARGTSELSTRSHHRGALAGARGNAGRLEAGSGCADSRCGGAQGGTGVPRPRIVARYAALEALQTRGGALRRRGHRASHRCRQLCQCGGRRCVGPRQFNPELFTVADVHEMRVFVAVPQAYARPVDAQGSRRRCICLRNRAIPLRRNS